MNQRDWPPSQKMTGKLLNTNPSQVDDISSQCWRRRITVSLFSTSLHSSSSVAEDPLPENVLRELPTVRVRSGSQLLDDGQQCRICLQNFSLGQRVRILPCHHKVKIKSTITHKQQNILMVEKKWNLILYYDSQHAWNKSFAKTWVRLCL